MASVHAFTIMRYHKEQLVRNQEPSSVLAVLKNRHQDSGTWQHRNRMQTLGPTLRVVPANLQVQALGWLNQAMHPVLMLPVVNQFLQVMAIQV